MATLIEVPEIDARRLTDVVCRATCRESITLRDWSVAPLKHDCLGPATAGLYRVAGEGENGGSVFPWTVILKVLFLPEWAPPLADPSHKFYWKREALAYQSGLLDNLPGGLRAPRCLGVGEPRIDMAWLWLEEIVESGQAQWPESRYGIAARHLGQFNGAFAERAGWSSHPWIVADWLRQWVDNPLHELLTRPDTWDHPLVSAAFPEPVHDRLLRLWQNREPLLDALDRLPQTLCHLDTWRPNLFACHDGKGHEETVVIDWSFLGLAPVGGEIGQLIASMVTNFDAEPVDAVMAKDEIIAGYLAGLREAGWYGEEHHVRFAAVATAAIRWGWVFPGGMALPNVLDERRQAEAEQRWGQPIDALAHRWAAATYFLLDLADEALELLPAF